MVSLVRTFYELIMLFTFFFLFISVFLSLIPFDFLRISSEMCVNSVAAASTMMAA